MHIWGVPRGATAFGAFFLITALASCGSGASKSTPALWSVTFPKVATHSLDESLRIIGSDPKTGPHSFYVGALSAAAFAVGDSRLDTSSEEWRRLLDAVCGHDGLVSDALANGWSVTVTGYVDSSGPMGAGTLNDRLQIDRANSAIKELTTDCKIPRMRTSARKGGVGGAGSSARKVTVTYTRGA